MGLTDPGRHPADRTLTNAEVLLRLYRTIRQAAGDALLIGCNTVGTWPPADGDRCDRRNRG
jgi:alpha-galactosidase